MSESRRALRRAVAWSAALSLAGCCSSSPEHLADPDPNVRREALACLADDDPAGAVELAGSLIAEGSEPDPALRATALRVLGELEAKRWSASVAALLVGGPETQRDRNARVRQQAATTLGRLKAESQALAASVREDPDADVRWSAADALARSGDDAPQTLEALIAALDDASQPVRLTARRSLRELTRLDHGSSASAWRTWLRSAAVEEVTPEDPGQPYADEVYEDEVYEDEVYEDEVYEDEAPPADAPEQPDGPK
ncbi:MAG: HEAT repeat domain-containing protein [Planctomycetes bacterium]|nr:HEAT repeat domain-containing protein [Planctomycetota bacterium]